MWDELSCGQVDVVLDDHVSLHESSLRNLIKIRSDIDSCVRKRRQSEAEKPEKISLEMKLSSLEGRHKNSFSVDIERINDLANAISLQRSRIETQSNSNNSTCEIVQHINHNTNTSLIKDIEHSISSIINCSLKEQEYHLGFRGITIINELNKMKSTNSIKLSNLRSQYELNRSEIVNYEIEIAKLNVKGQRIQDLITQKESYLRNHVNDQLEQLVNIKSEWLQTKQRHLHNQSSVEKLISLKNEMIEVVDDIQTTADKEFNNQTTALHRQMSVGHNTLLGILYEIAEDASLKVMSFVEKFSDDGATKSYAQHEADVINARRSSHFHCLSKYVDIVEYLYETILSKKVDVSEDFPDPHIPEPHDNNTDRSDRIVKLQYSTVVKDPLPPV